MWDFVCAQLVDVIPGHYLAARGAFELPSRPAAALIRTG